MEMEIGIKGRSPKPRIINVKQYSSGVDRILFTLDEGFSDEAVCAVVGKTYRQNAELKGNTVVWNIAGEFTRKSGSFDIQLEITEGEKIWKSDVMLLIVSESTSGDTPVSAGGDIVGSILVYGITDNGIAGYIKPEIQETYVTICRGGSQRFTVQEVILDSVIWSVAGNTDSATAIDENGFLNVGENEESTSLTVTATTVDGAASCSVSAAVDLSVTVLRLFDSGELDICPMSGMVITQKQSNGTNYEITDRIYRIRTAVTNASTDIKVPFTCNLTGYSKLCFNGGFLTTYGSQYDILSVGLYDSSDSATTLTIHSGYGSFELEIDQTKEYSALMIGSCYGEIEITKIWLEP